MSRIRRLALGVTLALSITTASYADSIAYLSFNTSSGGVKKSSEFTRSGQYMYVCGDVFSGTTTHILKAKLIREIEWLPDTVQREVRPYYRDARVCSYQGFVGSQGEWYYSQAEWVDEGSASHNGSVYVERR